MQRGNPAGPPRRFADYCVPPAEAAVDGGEPFGLDMVLGLVDPVPVPDIVDPVMEPVAVPMEEPLLVPVVLPLIEPVSAGAGVTGAGVVTAGVVAGGMAAVSSFLPQAPSARIADNAMAVAAADLKWDACMSVLPCKLS